MNLARDFRLPRMAIPWLVYVGVTVVAPAANGAWRDAGFAGHALLTVGVSGALLLAWLGATRTCNRVRGVRLDRARSGPVRNSRVNSLKTNGITSGAASEHICPSRKDNMG